MEKPLASGEQPQPPDQPDAVEQGIDQAADPQPEDVGASEAELRRRGSRVCAALRPESAAGRC